MNVQYIFLQVPQYGKMFGFCFHQSRFSNMLRIYNPLKMKNNWIFFFFKILFMLRSTHSHVYGNNLSYTIWVEL